MTAYPNLRGPGLDLRPPQLSSTGPRFTALRELSELRKAAALTRNDAAKPKAAAPPPKAVAPKPTPPTLSAAERAAAERHRIHLAAVAAAERQKALAAEEARRKAAVTASWRKAATNAADPLKRARAALRPVNASSSSKANSPPAKVENYDWARIHAKAARQFGTSTAK